MRPPNVISTTVVCQTAGLLVTGVQAALNAAQGPSDQIQHAWYQLGEVAWDDCACGQITLGLGHMYLSREFPVDTSQTKRGNCQNTYFVQDAQLIIVRCWPIEGDDANNALVTPPKIADVQAATRRAYVDGVTAWEYLDCTLYAMSIAGQIGEYHVEDWISLGPMGGCGGISINLKLAWYRDCGCGDG